MDAHNTSPSSSEASRFLARLLPPLLLALFAFTVHPGSATAYTSANWTSGYCTSGGGAGGTQSYSIPAKQASATMTYNNTGSACYAAGQAFCSRSDGTVAFYTGPGNTIAQGVSTYDCDVNGTYNFALTNNATWTRTTDFSAGCKSANCA